MRSARSRPTSAASKRCSIGSDDLARLIRSPVFSAEEQSKAIARDCSTEAGITGLAGNFLRVVASEPPPVRHPCA